MFMKYKQCCALKILAHVYEMHNNVKNDYMKLVVNKLCHVTLLPERCMPSEVGSWDRRW
jgi:hypothetical protein